MKYLDNYEITRDGKCINKKTKKIKNTFISNTGYERVSLWNNGKHKNYSIHRLVAEKYIDNQNNYKLVNHIDGNKLNNNVENLEWCDASNNMQHAYKNNLIKVNNKKVKQYTKNMELVKEWDSITEVESKLGINHANIITVCNQKTNRKYAGGYIWRFE